MTTESKDPRKQLNSFARLLIDDLLNTPDAEILQQASIDQGLAKAGLNAKNSYQNAIKSTGAKRLEIARSEMKQVNESAKADLINMDGARAHRIIAKLSAANDQNLTLAARNLNNISDIEAIELVKELLELGAIKDGES